MNEVVGVLLMLPTIPLIHSELAIKNKMYNVMSGIMSQG